ncbi:MAG: hypothetical protein WDA07_01310 [Leucobacter sp.]
MAAAQTTASASVTPDAPVSRPIRLLRVVILLAGGLAILFTATLHEQLGFDLGIASGLIGAIGLAHLIDWFARRPVNPSTIPLLLGIVAILAAIALPFMITAIGFAVIVSAWSLVSALLEFISTTVRPGSRQDTALLGGIGVLLAILVLLLREDPVAVIGMLGAYAIIAGVFLGISAFDFRRGTAATPADLSAGSPAEPTRPSVESER